MLTGQSLIEHANISAPAAAGASAGAVIGQGLGRVLGAVGSTAEAASKTGTAKTTVKAPPQSTVAAPESTPPVVAAAASSEASAPMGGFGGFGGGSSIPVAPTHAAVRNHSSAGASGEGRALQPPAVPAAIVPLITRDELIAQVSAIQPGVGREDVLAKLGKPAYKVSSDEDGKLVEKFRFRAAGEDVASIELLDGVVSAVKPLAR